MYIYLIRHPETEHLLNNNFPDRNTLSERGRKQQKLTVKYINDGINIGRIYSSESKRCINLAKNINSKNPLEIIESLNEGTDTTKLGINSLLTESKESVLLVSHHHKIKSILAKLLQDNKLLKENVKIHPCSITIIRFDTESSSWDLIALNQIEHLKEFTRYHD